jgi:hypothetical protein
MPGLLTLGSGRMGFKAPVGISGCNSNIVADVGVNSAQGTTCGKWLFQGFAELAAPGFPVHNLRYGLWLGQRLGGRLGHRDHLSHLWGRSGFRPS